VLDQLVRLLFLRRRRLTRAMAVRRNSIFHKGGIKEEKENESALREKKFKMFDK
jgi:hypothetical protein